MLISLVREDNWLINSRKHGEIHTNPLEDLFVFHSNSPCQIFD